MKKLLLLLALLLAPSASWAQCNGVFPNNTVCGNITGASNTPRPTNPSAFLGAASGTSGQIQYNNSGALGGLTDTQVAARVTGIDGVYVPYVTTIAALKALTGGQFPAVFAQGYYTAGDPGAGIFYWSSASTATDNGGTIIQPTGGGTGRWIRQLPIANTVTPEMFGTKANGSFDDSIPIRAAMGALNTIATGRLELGCTTYNMASLAATAVVNNYSNVDIIGCGKASVLKLAAGLNTSSASFAFGIFPSTTNIAQAINNATYAHFAIDMNGQNNDCSGTCYAYNVALGAVYGDNITVDDITVLNNAGSQGIAFGGHTTAFPQVTDVKVINSTIETACDQFNAACTDHSGIYGIVQNFTIANNVIQNAGLGFGTGIEAHGDAVTVTGNTIFNTQHGMNLAADSLGSIFHTTTGIVATGNSMVAVHAGVIVYVLASTQQLGPVISGNYIQLTGTVGDIAGIYAASGTVSGSATLDTGLSITGNVINGALGGTIANANAFEGISLSNWNTIVVANNTIMNIGGAGIHISGTVISNVSIYSIIGNIIVDAGRLTTTPSTSQTGILFDATGTLGALTINANTIRNTSTAYMSTGILGSTNVVANAGLIYGNTTAGVTSVTWTGTGAIVGVTCGAGVPSTSFFTNAGIAGHC